MKRIFLLSFLFSSAFFVFGLELTPTSELLAAYLEHDVNLKNLTIDYQKTVLNAESTKIDNGFDIKLSTGTMRFSIDGDNSSFKVSPSVTARVPQWANLGVTVSSDMNFGKGDEKKLEDTSLKLSADIISSTGLNREISLLKSERSVLEAQRSLRNKAIEVEKSFYTEIKGFMNEVSSIMSKQHDLYEDEISMQQVIAKGYSKNSVTYRRAEMEIFNDKHEIQNMVRSLIHDYIVFYLKCGIKIEFSPDLDFTELIPTDIEECELLKIRDFKPENFAETEKAEWNHKINSMSRDAKKNFSLGASGGYTFKNSNTGSNTIDLGLESTIGGVGLDLGTNIPVGSGDAKVPSITLGVEFTPNTFKKNEITQKQNELSEEQEKLAISTAHINFGNTVVEARKEAEDLEWEKQSIMESLEMYTAQEKELASWYKQGVITESEYLSAKNSRQSYSVKKLTNLIDRIIYNDNLKLKFVEAE